MTTTYRQKALIEAEKNNDSTSARIIDSAKQLFSRKGYRGTTNRAIAELARSNLALVNYHWGSKEELWNAVHKRILGQLLEFAIELVHEVSGLDREEAIRQFARKVFNYLESNPNVIRFLEWQANQKKQPEWIEKTALPILRCATNLADSVAGLDFEPVDLITALCCIYGVISAFFDRPAIVKTISGEDSEGYSDEFREKAIDALRVMIGRFARVDRDNGCHS